MNVIHLCSCREFLGDDRDCPQHGNLYQAPKGAFNARRHVCPFCENEGEGNIVLVNNHLVLDSHWFCVAKAAGE